MIHATVAAITLAAVAASCLSAGTARASEFKHWTDVGNELWTDVVKRFPVSDIAIEPRSVQWNIVSDSEMANLCRAHGVRLNCLGMAAWDDRFQQCIIWTVSPSVAGWEPIEHELRRCQEGRFE